MDGRNGGAAAEKARVDVEEGRWESSRPSTFNALKQKGKKKNHIISVSVSLKLKGQTHFD